MMRTIITLVICLLFQSHAWANTDVRWRLALSPSAEWSLAAVDVVTGKVLTRAGNSPDGALMPASLVKLFVAGAVLEQHGTQAGLDMQTTVSHDGAIRSGVLAGNLYLMGRGNALLTADDLHKAARTMAGQGLRKVIGDIVVDDSLLDARGLERKRPGPGQAPAGALGLDLHTVAVTVGPAKPGKPPLVYIEPPNGQVSIAVAARTAATKTNSLRIIQLDDTSYAIAGDIPVGVDAVKRRFPLREPALYAAGVLRTALRQAGIEVAGKPRRGQSPAGAVKLVEIEAPDLTRLLRDMNVNSLNVVADNLFLLLGAERFGLPGTREKGARAVAAFIDTLGLPLAEVTIADGSGLRAENRATANFMARYLAAVAKKSWFGVFRDSLPRAGFDGTLKDLGYRNVRFRGKTGRLENAFALAGYGVDRRGRDIAFAYIVNVPGAFALNLERTGAEVMRYIAEEEIE